MMRYEKSLMVFCKLLNREKEEGEEREEINQIKELKSIVFDSTLNSDRSFLILHVR